MVGAKYRIRFRKCGDLRLVSHHDLMRVIERMLRRADLPFKSTEGFHPKPRMIFALSLPLGVAGLDEVLEIEFTESLPDADVLDRLRRQAPVGLELASIREIPMKAQAQPWRAEYRIAIPFDLRFDLSERCAQLLAQSECRVERPRPHPRQVDIRPYLTELRVDDGQLVIDVRVTPTGSARADEVLAVLGLTDLLDDGAVLERTRLEIIDETIDPIARSGLALVPAAAGTIEDHVHDEPPTGD